MHDIVLFGATGYTGRLIAAYLAGIEGLDWAVAGRDRARLEALGHGVPVLVADVGEPDSIAALARRARVLITTVGPYISYGEPLVAACAEAGTHYVDLTGEPEFVDRMYLLHHDRAVASGAKIVHACGFDSIPYDLGVLHNVSRLPEGVPIKVSAFMRGGGRPSGGTFHSAVISMSRVRQLAEASARRWAAEVRPPGRKVDVLPGPPRFVGGYALPMPTIDPQIVGRSAWALERYGPDFTYRQYFAVRRLPAALTLAGGAAALTFLAQIPSARSFLLNRLRPGDGPTPEQRAASWFKLTLLGEGGGARVVTEVSGTDPGYGGTAKMISEAALCLAFDDTPKVAGQVTTAVAMGDALIERLGRTGAVRFAERS
ncbi:saccharopine dehydrogenase family protein [Nonomuraea typhae]|uniref:saccharopine dehydrogenase family protein n=1 Tax=Nonomuraea typhae TaxID=2603600 RepID=UPI0012FC7919|nr:saccharopine dehydrogenase NADP-binding domain-containing protein [Nonomuraea typhae]